MAGAQGMLYVGRPTPGALWPGTAHGSGRGRVIPSRGLQRPARPAAVEKCLDRAKVPCTNAIRASRKRCGTEAPRLDQTDA
eukprot:359650-Chlamydomonas_euryale.AAC.17